MSFHVQPDWLPVVGKLVEVRLDGHPVRTGIVDAVTNDNSVLWLAFNGADSRTMVERDLGYEVWIDYKWEIPGRTSELRFVQGPS